MQLDECLRLPAGRDDIERAMHCRCAGASAANACSRARARAGFVRHCARRRRCGARVESARALVDIGFAGYPIGGLAVGEPQEVMLKIVSETAPVLPADRPRYLMGVGTPDDLMKAVARGIDMFDCVLPTRNGRHGMAFTRPMARSNLANARHADDKSPLDAESEQTRRREPIFRAPICIICSAAARRSAARSFQSSIFSTIRT